MAPEGDNSEEDEVGEREELAPALNKVLSEVGEDDELTRLRLPLEASAISMFPDAPSSTLISCPEALALLTSTPGALVAPGSFSMPSAACSSVLFDQSVLLSPVASPAPVCAFAAAAVATATATAAAAAADVDPEIFRGGRIVGPTNVHCTALRSQFLQGTPLSTSHLIFLNVIL
ncbi:hypothetical protein BGZ80_008466 [Entomortierella chlamydospora]|uniref:Uncharacterized protein n=1 Tax=Entomortierella chlamydospora TaxID=101097 RepID=A0A9P6T470_9FUNG|nr:hypothetical protein BGZ80_008466 [Entomortierella chlamydospora]